MSVRGSQCRVICALDSFIYADTGSEVDPKFYRRFTCLRKRFGRDNGTDADVDREEPIELNSGGRRCFGIVV
jgi:hypothetical protein